MKSLFIINTVYQLFIAINMRLHSIPDNTADLVVSDHTPGLKKYIDTLKESDLFDSIFYLKSLEVDKYFWGVPNDGKNDTFANSKSILKRTFSEPTLQYNIYDTIYTANFDAYIKMVHKMYPNIRICQIEDGAAICAIDWKSIQNKWNYIEGFNDIYDKVEELWLYSPDLMGYKCSAQLMKLPTILQDAATIKIFNDIFKYSPIEFPRFVFVEQSFEVDGIKNNDLEFMQLTFDIVGYDNLYIKPHPRNTIHRPFAFGLSKKLDDSVPFELMLLNNNNYSDSIYITVDSGSLISTRVIFEQDSAAVFLYKAISGKSHTHGNDSFIQYMNRFVEKYASKNLFVPGSLEEYRYILTHLK